MYSSALTARVVFLVVWCECVQLVRREGVRVREEWRGADRLPPQLSLHTAHLQDVCVQVRLRVLPLQANENLTIDFRDSETDSDTLVLLVWKQDGVRWCVKSGSDDLCQPHTARLQTREHERPIVNMTSHQAFWNLRYNCFPARTGSTVTVSVHRDEDLLISGSHVVQLTEPVDKDPVPEAGVSVDERQKRFTVRMETDQTVKIGLCYKQSSHECKVLKDVKKINKTTVNQTVDLSFPFLIPCVCVQLWFTVTDARRNTLCPLKERILPHGGDILSSSSARVLGSVLLWEPVCRDDQSDPSVSLCWRIHTQNSYCVPAPNATLYGTKREYNVSAVDQHPQMCVKFSLNGSHRVFCPFESERRSKWSVTVVPGSLRLHVHLTSDIAASFAAQLCDRDEDTCASRGHVFSRQLDGGATEAELSLPFPFLSSGLCVQVWRRDLHGRRIICPDFTHRRWGFVVGAALTLLAAVIVLVRFARWLLKKIPSVWRSERRPVLLVCSSNDAPHVAAVCSLASGLQGELCMDVRLAQWMQCHAPLSLAQLGPVPWLYGQCQAVQKAGGLVLIAWSPDARRAYLRWRKSELCKTGLYGAVEEDEEEQMCCDEERREKPTESSSITAPVFSAALSSLWMGIRGDGHGRGFGLVCFPSLDNNVSRIPKRLRCVRKYCLPKDLSSLIHDLTGSRDGAGKTRGRCWPRLLSKALSFFASRQLAPRLEAKLPVPTGSPKLPSMLSKKSSTNGNKGKTWRQKKRRSKVVSSFLSRKGCLKKKTPELHTPLES